MKTFSMPCLVRFLNFSGPGNKLLVFQTCVPKYRQLHWMSVVIHVMNRHRCLCKADSLRHHFENILTSMGANKNKKNKTVFPSWKTKDDCGFQALKNLQRKVTVIKTTSVCKLHHHSVHLSRQQSLFRLISGGPANMLTAAEAYVKSQLRTTIH